MGAGLEGDSELVETETQVHRRAFTAGVMLLVGVYGFVVAAINGAGLVGIFAIPGWFVLVLFAAKSMFLPPARRGIWQIAVTATVYILFTVAAQIIEINYNASIIRGSEFEGVFGWYSDDPIAIALLIGSYSSRTIGFAGSVLALTALPRYARLAREND